VQAFRLAQRVPACNKNNNDDHIIQNKEEDREEEEEKRTQVNGRLVAESNKGEFVDCG
jgi:hypothetical protein